jgi:hypothetical protein
MDESNRAGGGSAGPGKFDTCVKNRRLGANVETTLAADLAPMLVHTSISHNIHAVLRLRCSHQCKVVIYLVPTIYRTRVLTTSRQIASQRGADRCSRRTRCYARLAALQLRIQLAQGVPYRLACTAWFEAAPLAQNNRLVRVTDQPDGVTRAKRRLSSARARWTSRRLSWPRYRASSLATLHPVCSAAPLTSTPVTLRSFHAPHATSLWFILSYTTSIASSSPSSTSFSSRSESSTRGRFAARAVTSFRSTAFFAFVALVLAAISARFLTIWT